MSSLKSLGVIMITLTFAFQMIFSQRVSSPRYSFIQANNINTVFMNNGIFNYDWFTFTSNDAGLIWPVTSTTRKTCDFTTGIFIGAKINGQLRVAGSYYSSHYTGGNIPMIGQVPPFSVCNDTIGFRVYLVNLTDQTLVNGGSRVVSAGGRQYSLNFTSWASWPVNQGAPYFEVNNIPGYQPGWTSDRPSIGNGSDARPDQLLFTVYMDYTNCTNNIHITEVGLPGGTLPLGVEIQQLAFAFNCYPLQDIYFIKYRIINKSSNIWDSSFVTIANDADIGLGSCGAFDDASGCDSTRNLSFMYNGDNYDCNYLDNPPSIGSRILQGPLTYTANDFDTAKLPYGNFPGYSLLGLTAHYVSFKNAGDSCINDPENGIAAYYVMKGLNCCGNVIINPVSGIPTKFMYSGDACSRIGWVDSSSRDRRYFMSSGPFRVLSGDTQIVVFSFTVTIDGGNNFQNVCALQNLSDSALKYYYNDFPTCFSIGIQPVSNEVPQRFMLYQNYPNPFNPVTRIRFDIPSFVRRGAGVVVKIYNSLGQEIAALLNEQVKPGIYEVDWNAENYPSGVYFYKLITENFTDSKKMVIVK